MDSNDQWAYPSPKPGTVLDLFAGCGGLSTGLGRAGLDAVCGVELSSMAAATWAVNHLDDPPVDTHHDADAHSGRPLADQVDSGLVVAPAESLFSDDAAMGRLGSVAPQWVVGGPPCKGYSLAGRRSPDDERNLLAFLFIRFVERLRPHVVVMENVAGMMQALKGQKTAAFHVAADELAAKGYLVQQIKAEAWRYGVPQSRPRVLLVGLRDDIAGEHGVLPMADDAYVTMGGFNLEPTVTEPYTVRDAWWDLDPAGDRYVCDADDPRYDQPGGGFAKAMRNGLDAPPNHAAPTHTDAVNDRNRLLVAAKEAGLPDGLLYEAAVNDDRSICDVFDRLDITFDSGETPAEVAWRVRSKKRSQRVIDPDRPSPTVLTQHVDMVHPWAPAGRSPSVREYARLQGFPDSYLFRGNDQTGGLRRRIDVPTYSQIGNAVPPRLGEAVARAILDHAPALEPADAEAA